MENALAGHTIEYLALIQDDGVDLSMLPNHNRKGISSGRNGAPMQFRLSWRRPSWAKAQMRSDGDGEFHLAACDRLRELVRAQPSPDLDDVANGELAALEQETRPVGSHSQLVEF